MVIKKICRLCNGDHTEVKCPRLDGYIQHLNIVVKRNTPSHRVWVDSDYQRANGHTIWRSFADYSTSAEQLGLSRWDWSLIVDSYCKKLNYRMAGKKRQGKKRIKPIKCGYCQSIGHTRRKCSVMQGDIVIAQDASKIQRAMFLDKCKELGLGIGALIKFDWTQETHTYSQYHADLPKSVMGVVTSIPTSDINPFIRLERWDAMFHFAQFDIKLINAVGQFEAQPPTSFHLTKNVFNGEFTNLTPNFSGFRQLNRYYDSKIIAPSDNFIYSTTSENDYLSLFRKHPLRDLQFRMENIEKWLQQST